MWLVLRFASPLIPVHTLKPRRLRVRYVRGSPTVVHILVSRPGRTSLSAVLIPIVGELLSEQICGNSRPTLHLIVSPQRTKRAAHGSLVVVLFILFKPVLLWLLSAHICLLRVASVLASLVFSAPAGAVACLESSIGCSIDRQSIDRRRRLIVSMIRCRRRRSSQLSVRVVAVI